MVDPFDIYRTPPAAAAAPAADAGAEAARTRALLALRVQEKLATPAVGAATTAPAATPGVVSRLAAQLPTFGKMLGFGAKALPVVGAAAAPVGEAIGVARTAMDPNATGVDVGTRAAEGVGRLGAMGAGAGLGAVAGGPLGAIIGGGLGYVAPNAVYAARDWALGGSKSAADPTTATPLPARTEAPYPPTVGDLPTDPAGFGATPVAAPAPTLAPVAPMTAADINGSRVPVSGTGGFVNNSTGAVTNLDTRTMPAASEAAPAVPTGGYAPLAQFFGGAVRQRQAAAAEAREMALNKQGIDLALKLPGAQKDAAEGAIARSTLDAAEAARKAGANPADIGAILGRRAPHAPAPLQTPPNLQPISPDGKTAVVFNPNTASVMNVPIRTQATGGLGTDGKYYKVDSAGKKTEMTASEKAAYIASQRRGPGAVQ